VVGVDEVVGVEEADEGCAGVGEGGIAGGGDAGIWLADDGDAGLAEGAAGDLDGVGGGIGRAVVDDGGVPAWV